MNQNADLPVSSDAPSANLPLPARADAVLDKYAGLVSRSARTVAAQGGQLLSSNVVVEPMHLAIARAAKDLLALLPLLDAGSVARHEHGGVLWAVMKFLPSLAANMAAGLYAGTPVMPASYVPVPPIAAGWATLLDIQARDTLRHEDASESELAYGRGARWAIAQITARCPAAGPDDGVEPATAKLARKSLELKLLLDQVALPADDLPGGGSLALTKLSMEGLTRNMGQGLYIFFGILPTVTNPAYLAQPDWKASLQAIRDKAQADYPNHEDPAHYHYFEGVRWTLARYRDMFRQLGEAPRYPKESS
jgi:hypothetical protein